MDRKYIERHLMVDRYLQGTLPGGEVAAFEERLTWDQGLLDEVELAERLRAGLRGAMGEDSQAVSGDRFSIADWLAELFFIPQYAAAASFAFAVALTAGVLLNPFAAGLRTDEFRATPTEILPLIAVRGEAASPVVFNTGAQLVLLVDVAGSHASYRVTIRSDRPDAPPLWTQDDMLPSYLDSLAIGMPSDLLEAGPYVLTVEGVSTSDDGEKIYEHIQDISFLSAPAE